MSVAYPLVPTLSGLFDDEDLPLPIVDELQLPMYQQSKTKSVINRLKRRRALREFCKVVCSAERFRQLVNMALSAVPLLTKDTFACYKLLIKISQVLMLDNVELSIFSLMMDCIDANLPLTQRILFSAIYAKQRLDQDFRQLEMRLMLSNREFYIQYQVWFSQVGNHIDFSLIHINQRYQKLIKAPKTCKKIKNYNKMVEQLCDRPIRSAPQQLVNRRNTRKRNMDSSWTPRSQPRLGQKSFKRLRRFRA